MLVIVVPVAYVGRMTEVQPVYEAGMNQLIGQDERAVVGNGRQYAAVGMVSAVEDKGGRPVI